MTKKPQTIIKYSKLAFILPSVILKTCKYALKRAPQQWPVCCHTPVMAQLMEADGALNHCCAGNGSRQQPQARCCCCSGCADTNKEAHTSQNANFTLLLG